MCGGRFQFLPKGLNPLAKGNGRATRTNTRLIWRSPTHDAVDKARTGKHTGSIKIHAPNNTPRRAPRQKGVSKFPPALSSEVGYLCHTLSRKDWIGRQDNLVPRYKGWSVIGFLHRIYIAFRRRSRAQTRDAEYSLVGSTNKYGPHGIILFHLET